MSITVDEIRKLASLSRIQLSPEEEVSMQGEISSILGYVEEINNAKFADVEDGSLARRNVWRADDDANEPGSYTEKLLANVPGREGDHVKVKKIL